MEKLPTQSQLLLPLLETLQELGGEEKAETVIDALNSRLNIPKEIQENYQEQDFGRWGKRKRNPWRQKIHWVRQNAVCRNLIHKNHYGYWTLTQKGEDTLCNAKAGLILIVYETPNGQALWAEAKTAAGALEDESINLIFTSPPYPILNGRKYGTFTDSEIIELLTSCAKDWKRSLKPDGSLVLNLRDVWLPKAKTGGAVRSLYQEKLLLALCEDIGFYFADRLYWKNPSHSPESNWVTVQKVRTNNDIEHLFWLGKSPNPYADTKPVLTPAKPSTLQAYKLRAKRQNFRLTRGPSGQKNNFEKQMEKVSKGEPLQVIPRNCLEISNANTKQALKQELEKAGLPRHDATMPNQLAKFFIKMLTREGDTIYDPFYGSGTTGHEAEPLNRNWIGSDKSLTHLLASAILFPQKTFLPN